MALDRDLAVAVAAALGGPAWDGWEPTAATGVRGLRLLRESGAFASFRFSEAVPRSFEVLRRNVGSEPRARADLGDALAAGSRGAYDYVDVDPYGSPLRFLPRAIEACRNGGVLAVTATDLPVLAGAQPVACQRIYAARPVHGRLGPEGAVRILLSTILREAGSDGRWARPLLGYVGGHHVRAYVRLTAPSDDAPPVGTIDPERWPGPSLEGRGPFGPMWLGPLVDGELAARLAVPATAARPREVERLIARLREDAAVPAAFYHEPNRLASQLGLKEPSSPEALVAALKAAGHLAGRTHVRPEGVRTVADRAAVEAIARGLSP